MGITRTFQLSQRCAVLGALAASAILWSTSAYAQVDLGGKSMMGDLPFISNFASTAQDLAFLFAKVAGGVLATIGVFQIAKRDWNHAIPALLGGSGLFFMPQIIAALSKLGGGG